MVKDCGANVEGFDCYFVWCHMAFMIGEESVVPACGVEAFEF